MSNSSFQSQEEQNDQSDRAEASFQGDNMVDMEVTEHDFLSEGKVESEPESDEDKVQLLSNNNVTKPRNKYGKSGCTRGSNPNDSADEDEIVNEREHRHSMEMKIDSLTNSLKVMQDMMQKKGYFDPDKEGESRNSGNKQRTGLIADESETNIYKKALEKATVWPPRDLISQEIVNEMLNKLDKKIS